MWQAQRERRALMEQRARQVPLDFKARGVKRVQQALASRAFKAPKVNWAHRAHRAHQARPDQQVLVVRLSSVAQTQPCQEEITKPITTLDWRVRTRLIRPTLLVISPSHHRWRDF